MSDLAPSAPPQQPAAAPPTMTQKLTKWVSLIAGLIIAVLGGVRLLENFTLPSCESKRSTDAIHSIFKDKSLPDPTLTGLKTVTDTSAEKTCQAAYEIPNEKGALDYRVFWDGWSAKVMITKVN